MQLVVFKEDAFTPIKYVVCVKRYDYNPRNDYPERQNLLAGMFGK